MFSLFCNTLFPNTEVGDFLERESARRILNEVTRVSANGESKTDDNTGEDNQASANDESTPDVHDREAQLYSRVTGDLDTVFAISPIYSNLIDTVCPNQSTWTFSNILYRTASDSGSRSSFKFPDRDYICPEFGGRATGNIFPSEWFPNIALCTINLDSGITVSSVVEQSAHATF